MINDITRYIKFKQEPSKVIRKFIKEENVYNYKNVGMQLREYWIQI